EMLNMGFIEDIEKILQETPTERQTLLFSATMPKSLQKVTQRFMKEPEIIGVKSKELTVPSTEQYYMEVSDNKKFDVLCRSLDIQSPELAIVFVRTKRRVDEIAEALKKRGYSAERIHGDLTQATRDYVMRHFREGTIDTLVATDVAARGLDISGVTHVYNFDIPQDPESYVHRIGRTGRIGHSGQAITFVTSRELHLLRVIESLIRMKIPRRAVPTSADAIAGQQHLIMEKLVQVAESSEIDKYRGFAKEMLEENDSVTLLSAALKMLTKEPESVPVKLTEDSSYRMKKKPNNRPKNKHYNYNRSAKGDSRSKRSKSRWGR
ncbi:MAG TPA: DEAD/DEAH box helicase, partial [Peptococcaceae bacterium]|nr:DEAD/DEAH box helicase [Peptococcaceae bacterium]